MLPIVLSDIVIPAPSIPPAIPKLTAWYPDVVSTSMLLLPVPDPMVLSEMVIIPPSYRMPVHTPGTPQMSCTGADCQLKLLIVLPDTVDSPVFSPSIWMPVKMLGYEPVTVHAVPPQPGSEPPM